MEAMMWIRKCFGEKVVFERYEEEDERNLGIEKSEYVLVH